MLFFAAAVFFTAGVLLAVDVVERCCRFGAMGVGISELAVSAISNPNRAATSPSSSTFAALGVALASGSPCPARASNSFSSTPRSTKSS